MINTAYATVISIPTDFVSSTLSTASDFFSDLSPITVVIVGILIATAVIEILIGAVKK